MNETNENTVSEAQNECDTCPDREACVGMGKIEAYARAARGVEPREGTSDYEADDGSFFICGCCLNSEEEGGTMSMTIDRELMGMLVSVLGGLSPTVCKNILGIDTEKALRFYGTLRNAAEAKGVPHQTGRLSVKPREPEWSDEAPIQAFFKSLAQTATD